MQTEHELAVEFLGGRMSYPTIVYLDENFNLLSAVPGYMNPLYFTCTGLFLPRNAEPVLQFFK